jgi:hypothetical protein
MQAFQNPIRRSRKSGMAPSSTCSALVRFPEYFITSSANDGLLLSRYNNENQAQAGTLPARSTAPPQTTAHQETLQPLPSACPPTNNSNDVDEIDDDTLINQYDVSGGIGQEIFGALDTGGLEDVGEDEDDSEEMVYADKGK